MNYVCVVDSSLPPYAAPLARECVATVLVPSQGPTVADLATASWVNFVGGVVVVVVVWIAWAIRP